MLTSRLVWLHPQLQEQAKLDEQEEWGKYGNTVLTERTKANIYHKVHTGLRIYHYHTDHLGTPQELTNDRGDVVWLNYSLAWGGSFDRLNHVDNLDGLNVSADELQPIRFQGQFFDIETNLHYNRFRYYDSDVGMFVSRDPIQLEGGLNTFAYAPNPVNWIDPFGLEKFTAKTKQAIVDENIKFFGKPTCEHCGVDMVKPAKSQRGVTPPSNEWQTDHIEANVKGGANTEANGQLLCRQCNRDFWDKDKPNFKLQNRLDYENSQKLKKK